MSMISIQHTPCSSTVYPCVNTSLYGAFPFVATDVNNEAFDEYDFHTAYQAINQFCVVDMSNFYLDIIKDRLYT